LLQQLSSLSARTTVDAPPLKAFGPRIRYEFAIKLQLPQFRVPGTNEPRHKSPQMRRDAPNARVLFSLSSTKRPFRVIPRRRSGRARGGRGRIKARRAILTYFRSFCRSVAACRRRMRLLMRKAFSTCRSISRSHAPAWDSARLARPDSINDKLSEMVTQERTEAAKSWIDVTAKRTESDAREYTSPHRMHFRRARREGRNWTTFSPREINRD